VEVNGLPVYGSKHGSADRVVILVCQNGCKVRWILSLCNLQCAHDGYMFDYPYRGDVSRVTRASTEGSVESKPTLLMYTLIGFNATKPTTPNALSLLIAPGPQALLVARKDMSMILVWVCTLGQHLTTQDMRYAVVLWLPPGTVS
jgi:hypothetical protein